MNLHKMSKPILYSTARSPPCRAVFLAAEAIGLDLELREIDLTKKDQFKEEFVEMNPQHTLPTLDDDGFIIWDSHAIICYLAQKYGKNDALYPKDLKMRARIDQRLHFDSGILFALLRTIARPIFFEGKTTIPEENVTLVKDAYNFMNKFLEGKKWLVGDSYTLADISCVSSLSSLEVFVPVDIHTYPNVATWLKTCKKELPGYAKANGEGIEILHTALKGFFKKL